MRPKIQLYGDHRQLGAVEEIGLDVNYIDCAFMKELCNHTLYTKQTPLPGHGRFSDDIGHVCIYVWETGDLPFTRGGRPPNSYTQLPRLNITATNYYANTINDMFPDVRIGSPVISRFFTAGMPSGRICTVQGVNDTSYFIEGKWRLKT